MAHATVPFARHDGAWLRCVEADCDAYFGAFRPTDWLVAKFADHRAKAHGAAARPAGARPQRRKAAVAAVALAPAALAALAGEFAKALAGNAAQLGRGVARIGYAFGPDHVLKVARNGSEKHNRVEFAAYTNAPSWARPHLAPALAIAPDGSWLLVRRAERMGHATWQECENVAAALHHRIGDLHPNNVGWLDGRWVATDYAGGMNARDPWA